MLISKAVGLDEIIIGRMLAGKYRINAATKNASEMLRLFGRRRYKSAPQNAARLLVFIAEIQAAAATDFVFSSRLNRMAAG